MEKEAFNSKQLTSARIARGMTMKELAKKARLSREIVSNYESGKTLPDPKDLLKLIDVLKFPRSFFSMDMFEWSENTIDPESQSTVTKKVYAMQKERLKYFHEVYKALAIYVNFPKVNLPRRVEKDINALTEAEIIHKAMELRKRWEVGSADPVHHLIPLAEKNGIVVAEANMSDSHLGAISC